MPIYEFVCGKCGHEFEEIAAPDTIACICPRCGSDETSKMMSVCARHRGGSGQGGDMPVSSGGGCAGCSGGNCASCGR